MNKNELMSVARNVSFPYKDATRSTRKNSNEVGGKSTPLSPRSSSAVYERKNKDILRVPGSRAMELLSSYTPDQVQAIKNSIAESAEALSRSAALIASTPIVDAKALLAETSKVKEKEVTTKENSTIGIARAKTPPEVSSKNRRTSKREIQKPTVDKNASVKMQISTASVASIASQPAAVDLSSLSAYSVDESTVNSALMLPETMKLRFRDMDTFQGSRKLGLDSKEDGNIQLETIEDSLGPLMTTGTVELPVLPVKPSMKQSANTRLLFGGATRPKDRDYLSNMKSPSQRKKLPAPLPGRTTGHGLGSVGDGSSMKGSMSLDEPSADVKFSQSLDSKSQLRIKKQSTDGMIKIARDVAL